ncbi:RDD family protein [uncultured Sphingomonas sp.]|uniref:RDD family protein n=1 Tax=uncultured Sphingomonas sp. TaxID=158754 RepID=UPI0025CC6E6C|nr:RDD family protein [uncultured Sphingomonas sp.]
MARRERKARRPRTQRTLDRQLVTPEGVPLNLRLGSAGARAGAFLIDAIIMLGVLIGASLLILALAIGGPRGAASLYAVVWLLGFFLLRNFYFVLFEAGKRAATPGKRLMKLRVVSRDGARLTGSAVLARNLLREIEVFLPMFFLAFSFAEGMATAWTATLALGWASILLFLPLFNLDRLRAGDLIAGTWVVEREVRKLGEDLLIQTAHAQDQARIAPFSAAELDAYGAFELQRLEEVLRRNDRADLYAVATAIRRKLGRHEEGYDLAFLEAYYAALRHHLERKLLFGQRKRDKFDQFGAS